MKLPPVPVIPKKEPKLPPIPAVMPRAAKLSMDIPAPPVLQLPPLPTRKPKALVQPQPGPQPIQPIRRAHDAPDYSQEDADIAAGLLQRCETE